MVRHYRRQRGGGESVRLTTARKAFNDNMDDMTKRNEYINALYAEIDITDDDTKSSVRDEYIKALYDAINNTDDAARISSLEAKLTDVGAPTERPPPLSGDTEGGGRRRRKSRRSRRPRKSRRTRRSRKSRRSRRH